MEAQTSTGKYWVYAIVWTLITVALLVYIPAWFWVTLPFMLTYIVKGFDAM